MFEIRVNDVRRARPAVAASDSGVRHGDVSGTRVVSSVFDPKQGEPLGGSEVVERRVELE